MTPRDRMRLADELRDKCDALADEMREIVAALDELRDVQNAIQDGAE